MNRRSSAGKGQGRPYNRGNKSYGGSGYVRKNEQIRVPQVRVIGADGNQIGVMGTRDALKMAKDCGLDLVEVSATAVPPVCRITDYGRYMYEESKKQKTQKQAVNKIKELKFSIGIDEHDFFTKVRHGEAFLDKGMKVKLTLWLRGREMDNAHLGFEVIKRVGRELEQVGTLDVEPKLMGKSITVTMTPLPAAKRKPKFKHEDIEEDEEEEGVEE